MDLAGLVNPSSFFFFFFWYHDEKLTALESSRYRSRKQKMLNDNRKPISPSILAANGIERLHWVFRSIIGFVLVASQNSWLCSDLFGNSLFSIRLDPHLHSFPFFFFFLFFNYMLAPVHYSQVPQISLFNHFFIKNRSHSTIHTFKNYFATVFSVSAK